MAFIETVNRSLLLRRPHSAFRQISAVNGGLDADLA
jgi:hypothetical protein